MDVPVRDHWRRIGDTAGAASAENRVIDQLIRQTLIAHITTKTGIFCLEEDWRCAQSIQTLNQQYGAAEYPKDALFLDPLHDLLISEGTSLHRSGNQEESNDGWRVLPQRLIRHLVVDTDRKGSPTYVPYVGGYSLLTVSKNIAAFVDEQLARFARSSSARSSFFARSAHYMGSKAALGGALVEAIHAISAKNPIIVDLMAGSGAAAGAFARHWRVVASDAQRFSPLLAKIQGGGFTLARARGVLDAVIENARRHFNELSLLICGYLEAEDGILTSEISPDMGVRWTRLLEEFPVYGKSAPENAWSGELAISSYRADRRKAPYLLFTAYYANMFFGIRQAAEIDSLRYAVDQIEEPDARDWALGALICAVSACATTYGGHFAQPKVDPSRPESILTNLGDTLEKRSRSVFHEFSARFLSLARESEGATHAIQIVDGPWQKTLDWGKKHLGADPVIVYVDPPYTRDEYSRYYHVLETLVSYNYPVVAGKSNVPAKGEGGRFRSEFFSRNSSTVENALVGIIERILCLRWSCALSYSNAGVADLKRVVDRTLDKVSADCRLFQTPYVHKPQGQAKSKSVVESICLFTGK